ncbi:MAG: hypothetical protein GXO80_10440 [Chlorobi bacterium]|nr:hypothetical protein [Chlorobiota bacterium]
MKRISLVQYSAVGLILLSLLMYYVYYNQTGNFNSPIIEFEFVKNQQDVKNIFLENNEIKHNIVKGVKDQNIVDYAYMFFYASLLFFAFRKLSLGEKKKIYYIGIAFSIIALISDIIENIQLFQISELLINRIDFSKPVKILFIITRLKWLSLAFAFIILSVHYYKYKFLGKLFALISILPLLSVLTFIIFGNSNNSFYNIFTGFIMLAFVILMIWIFIPHKNNKENINFYNSVKNTL